MQLAEENKKPSPFVRSASQFSTIPEEPDFDEMSNAGSRNRAEDCCTPDQNPLSNLRPLARAIQVPNRIRRLRSKHSQNASKNLWFTGSYNKSFNRCEYFPFFREIFQFDDFFSKNWDLLQFDNFYLQKINFQIIWQILIKSFLTDSKLQTVSYNKSFNRCEWFPFFRETPDRKGL